MIRIWVDFDKNMVYGNQVIAIGHFSPFLGFSREVTWRIGKMDLESKGRQGAAY